jgi:hypothetical protein
MVVSSTATPIIQTLARADQVGVTRATCHVSSLAHGMSEVLQVAGWPLDVIAEIVVNV